MSDTEKTENRNKKSTEVLTAKQSLSHCAQRWRRIKFHVACLDRLTGGGLPSRGIVEIAGDAGSGKTQLALHLALVAQFQLKANPRLQPRGVVYICTEHPFPSRRITQMEQALKEKRAEMDEGPFNFTDNIFVEHLNSSTALEQCISDRLPVLLENNPIELLIIDSIAAVYGDEQNYVDRAHSFRRVVHALHSLQEQFDFATVCTNQVRSVLDDASLDDEKIVPALGLAWASLVHTRIQLSRIIGNHKRTCRLQFSPTIAPGECQFLITEAGISDAI
ncbi:DNA repair protein XRCC3 [Topomyia yanbarensis]|uniref:DNA repair protein XRCC3 n=1 Tax=Topomyia yanbarensis TaxID=2498891 RepID=UPI00273BD091|nr:DNA repair protein XRCC3 [Topomyia yanbarensis]